FSSPVQLVGAARGNQQGFMGRHVFNQSTVPPTVLGFVERPVSTFDHLFQGVAVGVIAGGSTHAHGYHRSRGAMPMFQLQSPDAPIDALRNPSSTSAIRVGQKGYELLTTVSAQEVGRTVQTGFHSLGNLF